MVKKSLTVKAGIGTQCSIFTKFLQPPPIDVEELEDGNRTNVVLVREETVTRGKKEIKGYICTIVGWENAEQEFWAPWNRFKKEKEGPEEGFFTPLTQEEKEERRVQKASAAFIEPKIKWRKSKAKQVLYEMIMEGIISDVDDESENIEEIYLMNEEFAKYDYGKFADRLSTIRDKIKELNKRAEQDDLAFKRYAKNHKTEVSEFTSRGYVHWKGSDARELLLDDIEEGKHKTMTPMQLWKSREEYKEGFPLHAFRSKLHQELRTAKYLFTLEEKAKGKKV